MKKFILYILFFIPFINVHSQSEQFNKLLKTSLSISEKYLYAANFNEAKKYIDTAHFSVFELYSEEHRLALALQEIRINSFQYNIYQRKSKLDSVLTKLKKLEIDSVTIKDKNLLAEYYAVLSSLYYATGKKDSSEFFNQKSLFLFNETRNYSKAVQIRGSILSRKHLALKAEKNKEAVVELIPDYKKEIKYAKKYDNKYVLAYNTRHLAQIYFNQLENYAKALELFTTSMKLREEIGFKLYFGPSYSSVGDAAIKLGNEKLAIEMYQKSINLSDSIGFIRFRINSRIKMGDIYLSKKKFEKAKSYYQQAYEKAIIHDYKKGVTDAKNKLELIK